MIKSDYSTAPEIIKSFLFYLEFIKGRSKRTVLEYYTDLRTFFRFYLSKKNLVPKDLEINEIDIYKVDLSLIKSISLSDIYEYINFLSSERKNAANSRARKVSSLKSFFKYLCINQKLIDENPVENLELPSIKKTLPKFMNLEQSIDVLKSIDGENYARDYCIFVLFLNCGMRLSELVGINLNDISDDTIRIVGKGNKERIVYLNQSCQDAIKSYLFVRNTIDGIKDKNALFISRNKTRISGRMVQLIVEENLKKAGLSNLGLSTHKLRHTAATLMYQHGNVDIRVLQDILGHANLGTTEIYTHISNTQAKKAIESNPLSNVKIKKNISKD